MKSRLPAITKAFMRKIDEIAPQNGLQIIQMMEHAGLQIARFAESFNAKRILILAGKGNNGGDGIAAARFLKNWGYKVKIIIAVAPSELKDAALQHFQLIKKMEIPVTVYQNDLSTDFQRTDLIIDALLGYPTSSNPRDATADMITAANKSEKPILAVDIPSGLDATTGKPYQPCIQAVATITLGLPKTGLITKYARPYVGKLFLTDLGIPDFIYQQAGIEIPPAIFKKKSIIRL